MWNLVKNDRGFLVREKADMILTVSIYCTLPHKIDKIQLKKCGTRYEKRKKGICGQHWTFMNYFQIGQHVVLLHIQIRAVKNQSDLSILLLTKLRMVSINRTKPSFLDK